MFCNVAGYTVANRVLQRIISLLQHASCLFRADLLRRRSRVANLPRITGCFSSLRVTIVCPGEAFPAPQVLEEGSAVIQKYHWLCAIKLSLKPLLEPTLSPWHKRTPEEDTLLVLTPYHQGSGFRKRNITFSTREILGLIVFRIGLILLRPR